MSEKISRSVARRIAFEAADRMDRERDKAGELEAKMGACPKCAEQKPVIDAAQALRTWREQASDCYFASLSEKLRHHITQIYQSAAALEGKT